MIFYILSFVSLCSFVRCFAFILLSYIDKTQTKCYHLCPPLLYIIRYKGGGSYNASCLCKRLHNKNARKCIFLLCGCEIRITFAVEKNNKDKA